MPSHQYQGIGPSHSKLSSPQRSPSQRDQGNQVLPQSDTWVHVPVDALAAVATALDSALVVVRSLFPNDSDSINSLARGDAEPSHTASFDSPVKGLLQNVNETDRRRDHAWVSKEDVLLQRRHCRSGETVEHNLMLHDLVTDQPGMTEIDVWNPGVNNRVSTESDACSFFQAGNAVLSGASSKIYNNKQSFVSAASNNGVGIPGVGGGRRLENDWSIARSQGYPGKISEGLRSRIEARNPPRATSKPGVMERKSPEVVKNDA